MSWSSQSRKRPGVAAWRVRRSVRRAKLAFAGADHLRDLLRLLGGGQLAEEAQLQGEAELAEIGARRAQSGAEQALERGPAARGQGELRLLRAGGGDRCHQALVAQELERGAHQLRRGAGDPAGEEAHVGGEVRVAPRRLREEAEGGEPDRLGGHQRTVAKHGPLLRQRAGARYATTRRRAHPPGGRFQHRCAAASASSATALYHAARSDS